MRMTMLPLLCPVYRICQFSDQLNSIPKIISADNIEAGSTRDRNFTIFIVFDTVAYHFNIVSKAY